MAGVGSFPFNQQPSVRLKLTWDITNAVSPWQISLSAGQLGLCWGLDDPLLLRAIKLWVWDPRPTWIVCLWYSANIVRNWKQTCKQPQTKNNPQCSRRRISRAVLRLTFLTEAPSQPEVESDLISEAGAGGGGGRGLHFHKDVLSLWKVSSGQFGPMNYPKGREWLITFI